MYLLYLQPGHILDVIRIQSIPSFPHYAAECNTAQFARFAVLVTTGSKTVGQKDGYGVLLEEKELRCKRGGNSSFLLYRGGASSSSEGKEGEAGGTLQRAVFDQGAFRPFFLNR